MDPSDKHPDRRLIATRRASQGGYSSRFRASNRGTRYAEDSITPDRMSRTAMETLQQEMSFSFSPFPTEEELSVLEKHAPGSPQRLIDATIDRIESRTENYRENGNVSRQINRRSQGFAISFAVVVLLVACYFAWLGDPTQAAVIATTLIVASIIAFLSGTDLKLVAPWILQKSKSDVSEKSAQALPDSAQPE